MDESLVQYKCIRCGACFELKADVVAGVNYCDSCFFTILDAQTRYVAAFFAARAEEDTE